MTVIAVAVEFGGVFEGVDLVIHIVVGVVIYGEFQISEVGFSLFLDKENMGS